MIEGLETGCNEPQKTIQLGLFCLDARNAQFQLIFPPVTFALYIFQHFFCKVTVHQENSTLEKFWDLFSVAMMPQWHY